MKINKINSNNLRNDEHFQFHTEFKDLAIKETPQKLKIQPQFEAYLPLYGREGVADYENFIRTLNAVVAKYTAVLNARLGKRGKKEAENTQNNGGSV